MFSVTLDSKFHHGLDFRSQDSILEPAESSSSERRRIIAEETATVDAKELHQLRPGAEAS
jgi:hypothetical protein